MTNRPRYLTCRVKIHNLNPRKHYTLYTLCERSFNDLTESLNKSQIGSLYDEKFQKQGIVPNDTSSQVPHLQSENSPSKPQKTLYVIYTVRKVI